MSKMFKGINYNILTITEDSSGRKELGKHRRAKAKVA